MVATDPDLQRELAFAREKANAVSACEECKAGAQTAVAQGDCEKLKEPGPLSLVVR